MRALETLQNLLCDYVDIHSASDWDLIFNSILFPMMQSCAQDLSRQSVSAWPAENRHITTVDPNSWIGTMALPVRNYVYAPFHLALALALASLSLPLFCSSLSFSLCL